MGHPLTDKLFQDAISAYGAPELYMKEGHLWSLEKTRSIQNERLIKEVARASKVPFYQRLWAEKGFDPKSFRGLEDLHKIPMYTINEIRESISIAPPYGDYQGVLPGPENPGTRLYFSGGTTGAPRPTVYTPWDRVVGSLLGARQFYMHGFEPGQIVLNSFGYSTHNGAFIVDEVLWNWLGCTLITTSTGVVTSSVKQLQLAKDYKAVSIVTTADYLVHLRKTADEMGLKPSDFNFKYFSTIGDTAKVEEAWGLPTYEYYAFHEVQSVASECKAKEGMHVFDDAFIVEVVDTETGKPLPPGEVGDLVVTCLYKTGSPQVRFNIKDLTSILPGTCSCGSSTTRIGKIVGRSDTMIKLRGINVWPEAIGSVVQEVLGRPVEYFVVAYTRDQQEQMRVLLEYNASDDEDILAKVLKERLGVKLEVQKVKKEVLDPLTGNGVATKLRRFKDERKNDKSEIVGNLF